MIDRVRIIAEGLHARERSRDRIAMRGLDRVEISVIGELSYRARSPHEPDGTMRVGEPMERGGDGLGASPLAHFLAGAGSCLLNQFVRIGITEGYPVTFTAASVRGEFQRGAGGAFERITCEVRGEGTLRREDAARLAERAERLCYVHQTLKQAIEMTTVLVLDGIEIVRRVEGPDQPG